MPALNAKTIEERVGKLGGREFYSDELLFELLAAYGRAKSSVTLLRSGSYNVAEDPEHEYALKNVVYWRNVSSGSELEEEFIDQGARETRLIAAAEELRKHERVVRFKTRFAIVSDNTWLAAVDTKTGENRVFPIATIGKHYAFFLPWAGMEKAQYTAETPADTRAAEKMGELFDSLVSANAVSLHTDEDRHGLNIFFTRLLFCYFAEDTDLFPEGSFTQAIANLTQEDGSDTAEVIKQIFQALDQPEKEDLPAHLQRFPYVNGRLFSANARYQVPTFDRKSRDLLLRLGRLRWQDINPDIFGSMFQAVVHTGSRAELGQHYTSVPNILKTIEPLFLDDLREQFDESRNSLPKLKKLLQRIGDIKVFDPACGSGNFLVIAYKELRRLEHAILDRMAALSVKHQTLFTDSVVKIDHFFGIEIDDFATEVAILALWIAKHQMNREYKDKFGAELPMIPLKSMGQIHCANATRVNWEDICPHTPEEEVYLIGNPPYIGSKKRTKEQTADLEVAYGSHAFSKNVDYIAAWFIKGSEFIRNTRSKLAFVSTNSICQGQQPALIFPIIFSMGLEIGYAYTSFKWTNNARHNAGVTVVVVSLRNESTRPRFIFTDERRSETKHINPYLTNTEIVSVTSRRKPIAHVLPKMRFGMMAFDGGHLMLNEVEKIRLLQESPEAAPYIREFLGSKEFINGEHRHALWITPETVTEATKSPFIQQRVEETKRHRISLNTPDSLKLAEVPYRFREQHNADTSIIVPSISSGRREYIPIGFLDRSTIISNKAFAVYDAEPWVFSLLTSAMHMTWTNRVSGRMREDYQYSNTLVYNTFPVPHLTGPMKEKLTLAALRILDVREYFCEKTLAELYDPEEMPDLLREAHAENDALVDSIYRESGFSSDEERLAALFKLYSKMIAEEEAAAAAKKASKRGRGRGRAGTKK